MALLQRKSFSCWAVVCPSEDLPGQWTAHCLDFDVVSQGNSPTEAIEMVQEAVGLVLASDLNGGRDPYARRAPSEDWALLESVKEAGEKVEDLPKFLEERDPAGLVLAVPLTMHMTRRVAEPKPARLPAFASEQLAAAAC